MGNFKRYDGYVMHIPQEFIDSKLPVCPFCKSDNPHWLLDSKLEMSLAGSRTYYQCERCQAIISSTAADAGAEKGKSFAINPAMAAMNAAQKGVKKQEVGVAYMRVDTLGTVCTDQSLMGQEFPITYFQEMAAGVPPVSAVSAPAAGPAFCSNCGASLKEGAQFCTGCGTKVAAAVAAPVAEPTPAAEPVVVPPVRPVEDPASQEPVILAAPVAEPAPVVAPVAEPVAAPVAAAPHKFPIAPMILVGLAAFYQFIMLFVGNYNFGTFFTKFLNLAPYALLVVSLILCKKEKNALFGIGFLAFAATGFLSFIISLINYTRWGVDISGVALSLVTGLLGLLPMAMIGVHYLVGKAKVLKIIGVILELLLVFIAMIASMVNYPSAANVFSFLFSVVLMVGVLIYDPAKK